jgi:hypothetical protein
VAVLHALSTTAHRSLGGLDSVSALEKQAKTTKVRLEDSYEGWKLVVSLRRPPKHQARSNFARADHPRPPPRHPYRTTISIIPVPPPPPHRPLSTLPAYPGPTTTTTTTTQTTTPPLNSRISRLSDIEGIWGDIPIDSRSADYDVGARSRSPSPVSMHAYRPTWPLPAAPVETREGIQAWEGLRDILTGPYGRRGVGYSEVASGGR